MTCLLNSVTELASIHPHKIFFANGQFKSPPLSRRFCKTSLPPSPTHLYPISDGHIPATLFLPR
jgi:hypothetical protein